MPTIAVVGAGPGLGLSIARAFGDHGFAVALVARTQEKLDRLTDELNSAGIEAAGFAADVMDRSSIKNAFDRITERFGTVDVLEYSPATHDIEPGPANPGPLEATFDNLQPQLEYYLYGGIAATQQVLPEMIARKDGTIIYTTGGSSMDPLAGPAEFTAITIASGALRSYALKLHQATAGTGVYVVHVPIFAWIGCGGTETQPDTIAQHYWKIHEMRDGAEQPYAAL